MDALLELWLPILCCAIAVWFASFICWALSPHHKPDWQKSEKEDDLRALCRELKPGRYIFPFAVPSDMKDPDKKANYEAGPFGTLNVWAGMPNMGKNMLLTFLTFVVTSTFIGYLASFAVAPGESWVSVFRFTGTAGVLAYCFAALPNDIWFGTPKRAVIMNLLDGVLYGIVTGIVFASMWPAAINAV